MKTSKQLFVFAILLLFFGCASMQSTNQYKKMAFYPDPMESEKVARIYYDMLLNRPVTEEDKGFFVNKTAAGNPVGEYLIGHMAFVGKNYKAAKGPLKPAADKGFGLAQYEYAVSNIYTRGKVYESYAYLLLASKSNLKEASTPAKALLEEADKLLEKKYKKSTIDKTKIKANALAEKISSAYLPEFERDVQLTEIFYFGVLVENSLDFYKKSNIEKDTKSYADEKRQL